MSGYQSQSNILGSAGRLDGSGKGWCGTNANSWLQVDLGKYNLNDKICRISSLFCNTFQ